ncbi:hypothetical protein GYA19_03850 [Candidatus Beckwithbacteria bacterium]|nr:hypothetical protein [Candidatus Beckwithbacteria bacterium]
MATTIPTETENLQSEVVIDEDKLQEKAISQIDSLIKEILKTGEGQNIGKASLENAKKYYLKLIKLKKREVDNEDPLISAKQYFDNLLVRCKNADKQATEELIKNLKEMLDKQRV